MSGYKGFSMSNNAVEAYHNGEKPFSKWTKTNILETIKKSIYDEDLVLQCDFSLLQKVPVTELKNICLYCSSWHHTSEYYNRTNFYALDSQVISTLTNENLETIIERSKMKKENPSEEKWRCSFLEWSGSKRHPKATEITEEGIVKGDWFIRQNGSKKKITANGFKFIEKLE
jgi:hypothetical protein